MQIVNQHQPKIVEPAAFCVHFGNRDCRVVVHTDVRLAERGRGDGELVPILLCQLAGDKLLVVDKAFVGQKPHCQLLARHFQRKERDGLVGAFRDRERHVQRHRRFAHAGSRRNEQKVRFIQAVDLLIQIMKPGRKPRNFISGLGKLLQPVIDVDKDLSDVL